MTSTNPNYFQKVSKHWGLELQHMDLEGIQTFSLRLYVRMPTRSPNYSQAIGQEDSSYYYPVDSEAEIHI